MNRLDDAWIAKATNERRKPPAKDEAPPVNPDEARAMLAGLTGDIARCDAELDRVHQAAELLHDHHRDRRDQAAGGIGDMRPSHLTAEYLDHAREAQRADALANADGALDHEAARDPLPFAKADQPSMFGPSPLIAVKKTVRRKGGAHVQTYHVRPDEDRAPVAQPGMFEEPASHEHYPEVPAAEGTFKARRMTTPIPLYRSVSLGEAASILMRGRIQGGGNTFNPFDHRRHVFFAAKPTERVLGLGESLSNQATWTIQQSPIAHEHARRYQQQQEALAALRTTVLDQWDAANKRRERAGLSLIIERDGITQDTLRAADHISTIEEAMRFLGRPPHLEAPLRRYREAEERTEAAGERYRQAVASLAKSLREALTDAPFTSVVLRTRPLSGGLEYHPDHGGSGMGDKPEYAFPRDAITLDDIAGAHLIRKGRIVKDVTLDELRHALKAFIITERTDAVGPPVDVRTHEAYDAGGGTTMTSPAAPDTITVDVPPAFYDDHVDRDLPAGRIIKRTKRAVTVELDREAFDDLLSDAEHYADGDMAQALIQSDKKWIGVVASARATAKHLRDLTAPAGLTGDAANKRDLKEAIDVGTRDGKSHANFAMTDRDKPNDLDALLATLPTAVQLVKEQRENPALVAAYKAAQEQGARAEHARLTAHFAERDRVL